jgi:hypothetical protein
LIKEEPPKDLFNKVPPKEKEDALKKDIKPVSKEPEQKRSQEPPPPPKEKDQEKPNLFKKKEDGK